jgi:protein phosphatase
METYACTDRGKIRKGNEDAIYCNVNEGIFIVADGMGGHYGGEIASQIAVEVIAAQLRSAQDISEQTLIHAYDLANDRIFTRSQSEDHKLMGTTASLLFFSPKEGTARIGHVGDSRIYQFRQGQLQRLTKDHSYVEELIDAGKITREEAFFHPNRNIITRALGTQEVIETDLIQVPVKDRDIYLLCSDGLSGKVTDSEIAQVLQGSEPLQGKGSRLLEMALDRGGEDNISLILLETEVEA